MFCNTCGSPNADQAQFCEKCGSAISRSAQAVAGAGYGQAIQAPPPNAHQAPVYQAQVPYNDPRIRGTSVAIGGHYAVGKSPILALFLSFLLPGVGQFYNGDTKRGLPMFLIGLFSYVLVLIPIIGWVIAIGVHIWSMVNAYSVANQKTPLA